jgi:hypothetical protein
LACVDSIKWPEKGEEEKEENKV